MKKVVIYCSKTGYTRKYAEWIADQLETELINLNKLHKGDLSSYDLLIFGGGLYAGGINGLKKLRKIIDLKKSKLVIYICGVSTGKQSELSQVLAKNFSDQELGDIDTFFLRGGFDNTKLKTTDRFLMRLMRIVLLHKKELSQDERGMLAAFDKPVDFCSKQNIIEMINRIKQLEHDNY